MYRCSCSQMLNALHVIVLSHAAFFLNFTAIFQTKTTICSFHRDCMMIALNAVTVLWIPWRVCACCIYNYKYPKQVKFSYCRGQDRNGVWCLSLQPRFTCLEFASISSWPRVRSNGGQTELDRRKDGRSNPCHPAKQISQKSHLVICPFWTRNTARRRVLKRPQWEKA